MAHRVSRRMMIVGSVSLALHAGVLWLLVVLGGTPAAPPVLELTQVELVAPPPPTPLPVPGPSAPGTVSGSGNSPRTGVLGRRGHDTPQRSQTRAPVVASPFSDLVMGYDAPTETDPGNRDGITGQGLGRALLGTGIGAGAGYGYLGDGPGELRIPSLAQPPRPKHAYRDWQISSVRQYAGKVVLVALTIDPRGKVNHVRVLRSVDGSVDRMASEIARGFEFYPALNDVGEPTSGPFRWAFVIVDNGEDEAEADDDGLGRLSVTTRGGMRSVTRRK